MSDTPLKEKQPNDFTRDVPPANPLRRQQTSALMNRR
jgi:hypothetical protein